MIDLGVLDRVTFAAPWALVLLVVPLALTLWRPRKREVALPLPMGPAGLDVPRSLRQRLMYVPGALQVLGACLLIVALARPQLAEGRVRTTTEAIAIQLVVDRSASMQRQMDYDGAIKTRMEVVKSVLHDFLLGDGRGLAGRESDLIGLISFARFAETNCPLIRDPRTVVQLVDAIELAQQRYEDGTAIGDGLALAAARLRTAEQEIRARDSNDPGDESFSLKSKVIVLLTDGDNNAGERAPIESAQLAADWGIRVYTIGVGGPGFQIVRTPFGEQRVPVGNEIDEETLGNIATMTGGKYWRATDAQSLRQIAAEIDRLERSEVRTVDAIDYVELFAGPAAIGAAALAARALLAGLLLRRLPA